MQGTEAIAGGIMVAMMEAMAEQATAPAMAPAPWGGTLGKFYGYLVRPVKHIAGSPIRKDQYMLQRWKAYVHGLRAIHC